MTVVTPVTELLNANLTHTNFGPVPFAREKVLFVKVLSTLEFSVGVTFASLVFSSLSSKLFVAITSVTS